MTKDHYWDQIQDISNLGYWEYNLNTEELYWSKNNYQLYEVEPSDKKLNLDYYLQLVHPEDRDVILDAVETQLRNPDIENEIVFRVLTQKRNLKFLYISYNARYDKISNSTIVYGITLDVTKQKNRESTLKFLSDELEVEVKERTIELERLNHKYRTLVETAKLGVAILDNGKIIYANPALANMFGYESSSEVLDKNMFDFASSRDKEVLNERYDRLKQNLPIGETFESTLLKKNGDEGIFEVTVTNIELDGDTYRHATCIDITDRVVAENRLKESEEKYRGLVERTPMGVGISFESQIYYANDALLEIFGYKSLDEFRTKSIFDHASENGRQGLAERFKKIQEGIPVPPQFECEYVKKDGTHIICKVSVSDIIVDGKKCRQGAFLDITELKEKERLLLTSEQKWKSLVTNAPQFIMLIGEDGKIEQVNKTLENMSIADVIGFNWLNFVPEGSKSLAKHKFETVISDGTQQEYVARGGQDIDKLCWYEIKLGPVYINDKVGKVVALITDISDQKSKEEALIRANEETKVAAKAKEEFLSIMSHEIRTPLNSVIGLTDLLIEKKHSKEQESILRTLKTSTDNLLHLVNDILDYSKIQSNKLQLEYKDFNISQLAETVISVYSNAAKEKGILLKLKIAKIFIDLNVVGDVLRLRQILNNLLSNALKFTSHGEVALDISGVEQDGLLKICIEVRDTGLGIPAGFQEHLFNPFEQANTEVTRRFGGTGLGLSIVKKLVELFDGEIEVLSEEGRGTTILVKMSLKTSHAGHQTVIIPKKNSKPLHLQDKHILCVEDVATNQFLMKSYLQQVNTSCDIASNGAEALKLIELKNYDLILMDIQMPDMDGYEVSQKIRNSQSNKFRNHGVPIICFTADVSEESRYKAFAAGMNDFIAKPVDFDQLLLMINSHLKPQQVDRIESPSFIDLTYFNRIFRNDQSRILDYLIHVKDDFDKFERDFFSKFESWNYRGMREEIHKIYAIASQLKFTTLLNVLDEYRKYDSIFNGIERHNQELKTNLELFRQFVDSQK